MKNISCCFTGHRKIELCDREIISKILKEEIVNCINNGITRFYAGGALGFDTLAAEAVLEVKKDYKEAELHIIIPCRNQPRGWSEEDVRIYNDLLEKADNVSCLSEKYYNGCMQVRNRYMVDNSSVCISYLTKNSGGSYYTVKYAEKNGLRVINIANLLHTSN